jgi:hypothetical protein
MNSHDESPTDVSADSAETEAFLRRISLSAMPMDRDRLVWDCGYEAGKAATGSVTPAAGGGIRSWLPLVTSTAAAFSIGLATAGAFSPSPTLRDADTEVVTSRPPVVAPVNAKPPLPASVTARQKKPRKGLYASMPLGRLEELLAAPSVPPELRGIAPPPDRPPLRIRDAMLGLDSIDL